VITTFAIMTVMIGNILDVPPFAFQDELLRLHRFNSVITKLAAGSIGTFSIGMPSFFRKGANFHHL